MIKYIGWKQDYIRKYSDYLIVTLVIISVLLFWSWIYFNIREISAAFATIILATITVFAIFHTQIINWWNRPKFEIACGNKYPFVVENNMIKFFRVKIRNFGRGPAEECYVRLEQVFRLDNHSSITDSINLKWAGAPEDKMFGVYKETKVIPGKEGRDFFDVFVIEPKLKDDYKAFLEATQSNYEKKILHHELIEPGKYVMYIKGSRKETRSLEFGGPDYLIYITIHSKEGYSKEFRLLIKNHSAPEGVEIKNITYNPKALQSYQK